MFTDIPSSRPIDIPDAKKRNKKKKRCRATDSFSGRFEGKLFSLKMFVFVLIFLAAHMKMEKADSNLAPQMCIGYRKRS